MIKINITKHINNNCSFKTVPFLISKQFSQLNKVQNPVPLVNLVLKKEFYKKVQNVDFNSSKKDIIQKEMVDHIDAKKSIMSDLAKIEPAQKAVEKISNNETPLKKEFTAYSDLKGQYEEHLNEDSDSDESNSYEFPKQNEQQKLGNLGTYLLEEYKSATKSLSRLQKQLSKLSMKTYTETSKRKMEESTDLDSSKKSRQSVHDFVESLPTDYNPLDDIGSDP